MFTLIGIILILFAAGVFVMRSIRGEFLPKVSTKLLIVVIVAGLFSTATFYADPGHSYKIYYPWGGSKIVNATGINFDWWGVRRAYQNEISFKYVFPKSDDSTSIPDGIDDNVYAYLATDHQWEFADAVKANIGVSVVVSINAQDQSNFSTMVDETKTENQLMHTRVIPDINTAIKNTCKLMYAQEYISGEAANFDRYLKDQLENGSYQLEPYYVQSDDDIIGDTSRIAKVSSDGNNKKSNKRWRIKLGKDGHPLRDGGKTSLALYHMTIRQAVSDNIDWEDKFDHRLDDQKAQVAATQLEKQLAEKEIYRQKKLYAAGEANKTEEKALLEKQQIQKTITAQTAAQVAAFTVQEEENLLRAARTKSERTRVEGDAKAYANLKLVKAGLTPQEKAEYENKRAIGVAAEIAKMTLPVNYVVAGGGSGKGGQTDLLSTLISAGLVNQLFTTTKN